MRSTLFALPLITAMLSVACAAETESITAEPPQPASATPTIGELQVKMDAFTAAIAARDVQSFESVVSSEVVARAVDRGIDMPALLDKQHNALTHTFNLSEGQRADIEIAEIVPEGDAIRTTLRVHGEELKKPFYFVREAGEYKLSMAPPGFSKTSPDGALFGKSNYTVHNVNIYGNAPFAIECYQGNGAYTNFIFNANSTRKVSCADTCGFWSGSTFGHAGVAKKCDWNAWGDDVVINQLAAGGWYCADSC